MSADEVEHVYNALDCCVTHEIFSAQAENLDDVAKATEEFSYALLAPVMEMSLRGTLIYEVERRKVLDEYLREHAKVKRNLDRLVLEGIGLASFNYASPKQVGDLFYHTLGLKPVKARNANGIWAPTTGRDALEKLQSNWIAVPFCKHIIKLRELDKKINFLETPRDDTGRLRSNYNVAGTTTGRLSSSKSDFGTGGNQQNIERRLRRVLIPDPGMKFCNVDLEQADARNVGAICWNVFVESHGEEYAGSYLDACESGDLHTHVCRMGWPDLEWGDDESKWKSIADEPKSWYREFSYRDGAKKLGHGTNYYGTPRTMAMHTKVATGVIKSFQELYFEGFPVIGSADHAEPHWNGDRYEYQNWHQYVRACLEHDGYIITPHFNRRRFFYGRPDDDQTLREAIAYAPQSMTADQIDTGIIRVWRALPEIQLLIQVHDSILLQYPEDREEELLPKILDLLTIRIPLKRGREFIVPVEAKIGWNWADKADDNPDGLTTWWPGGTDARTRPEFKAAGGYRLDDLLDA